MVKEELANKLLALQHATPGFRQIMDILDGYCITAAEERDLPCYQSQLSGFLGARRTEGLSPKTIGNYRHYLTRFGESVRKKAEDVTANDIRAFIVTLSDSGMKTSSMQHVVKVLRSFFGWLAAEEVIAKDPMLRVKSFKLDPHGSVEPLTLDELERLRDACDGYREKALVEFLYSTGCRLSEAVQIDTAAIDFERRTVQVVGKGNKTRTLYFSVRARLMVREYMLNRKGGDALFASSRSPYGRLSARSVQKVVGAVGARAGITRGVHPHSLRHTLATNALNAGMDITVIQELLGHSSVSTTQIYAKTNQEHVRRQHDMFVA